MEGQQRLPMEFLHYVSAYLSAFRCAAYRLIGVVRHKDLAEGRRVRDQLRKTRLVSKKSQSTNQARKSYILFSSQLGVEAPDFQRKDAVQGLPGVRHWFRCT